MENPPDGLPDLRHAGAAGVRTTKHRGRMTDAKRTVLAELGPRWLIAADGPWTVDHLDGRFGRRGERWLDIGVGDGRATVHWAASAPEADILAVELHRPGVSRLLLELDTDGPANIRVAMTDAVALVDDLPAGSFSRIRVLFPDPWPKRRHVDRRLVDPAFASAAAAALAPGGLLHLATDWSAYADHMRAAIATEPRLVARPGDGTGRHADGAWTSIRPDRPVTAYERRGIVAGRTIADLIWERADQPSG